MNNFLGLGGVHSAQCHARKENVKIIETFIALNGKIQFTIPSKIPFMNNLNNKMQSKSNLTIKGPP